MIPEPTASCFYCGRPLYSKASLRVSGIINKLIPIRVAHDCPTLTRDHVIPRSRAGGDSNNNVVPACVDCNAEKDSLTLEEYRAALAFRYGYISGITMKFPGEENDHSD